jgi:hypothetical protein
MQSELLRIPLPKGSEGWASPETRQAVEAHNAACGELAARQKALREEAGAYREGLDVLASLPALAERKEALRQSLYTLLQDTVRLVARRAEVCAMVGQEAAAELGRVKDALQARRGELAGVAAREGLPTAALDAGQDPRVQSLEKQKAVLQAIPGFLAPQVVKQYCARVSKDGTARLRGVLLLGLPDVGDEDGEG